MQTNPTPRDPGSPPNVFPTAAAYVKPCEHEGERAYAIHDQHGAALAVAPTRDMAFAFLQQQEIEGVDAH